MAEGEPFFDVTFFPDNLTFEPPPEFSSSIVQGKSYDLGDPRYSGYFGDLMQLDAYQWRCAITGSKIRPALQEAHILPVKPAHGGEHRLDNGVLLRSDVHVMFDHGYIGVDPTYRLRVSPRLRSEFGNGDSFYAKAGEVITLPERRADRPNPDFLQWHLERLGSPARWAHELGACSGGAGGRAVAGRS